MRTATIETLICFELQDGRKNVVDLSADERDGLLQLTADALDVAILNTLTNELRVPHDEATRSDLLERLGAAWDRVCSDADLLLRVVAGIDTAELEQMMTESCAPPGAVTKFLEIARREGGIRPMLEQRINDVLLTPWPTVRVRLHWHNAGVHPITDDTNVDNDFDVSFDLDEGAMGCAAGALAVTGGAGLAASGGGMLAGFALNMGVAMIAESC